MSGGGGGSGVSQQTVQQAIQPVPQTTYDTSLGTGASTPIPQTYTAAGKPAWMTGAWDMPSWGKDAATGKPLDDTFLSSPIPVQSQSQPAAATGNMTQQQIEDMVKGILADKEEYIPTGQFDIDVKMADLIARGQMSVADANKATESMRSAQSGSVNSWGGGNAATSGGNNSIWG